MTEYDKEYYEKSIEAMYHGSFYISKGRGYVRYKNKSFPLARALWNIGHPNDPVKITEVIHHKDGDKSNDSPDNLIKMSAGEHMQLHVLNKRGEQLPDKKKGGGYWKREVLNKRDRTPEEKEKRKLKKGRRKERIRQEVLQELGLDHQI